MAKAVKDKTIDKEKERNEALFKALSEVAKQNIISVDEALRIFGESVQKSVSTRLDPDAEIIVEADEKEKTLKIINLKKLVVEDEFYEPTDGEMAIIETSLSKAKKINKDIKVDDYIEEELDLSIFPKELYNHINQIFIQALKERKKDSMYDKFVSLQGTMIEVTVKNSDKDMLICEIEPGLFGFLPERYRNTSEPAKLGGRIMVMIHEVVKGPKGTRIVLTQGSKEAIRTIIENEVPEIKDGIVEIVNIARQVGVRSKVLVKALQPNIDPVGAIIGQRGSRINTILAGLGQEKIDVIQWTENIIDLITNSLEPSRVVSVSNVKNKDGEIIEGAFTVIVPNKHFTLAIGKQGTNVKLAVELLKLKLDIISMDLAKERGTEVLWNGNLTEAELDKIEAGEKLLRNVANKQKTQTTYSRPANNNARGPQRPVNNDINIEIDFESFKQGFENVTDHTIENDQFGGLSDEELKKMESQFDLFNGDLDIPTDLDDDTEIDYASFDDQFNDDEDSEY